MKKSMKIFLIILLIAFFIIGVIILIGPKNKTQETRNNKVGINEKTEGNNLSVTFTEFETPKDDLGKGSYKLGSSYEYTKEGYVNRLAHFTIENIGKETVNVNITATLNYGDGYTFNSTKTWFHEDEIYDTQGNRIEGGSWVNNSPDISPFDKPVECIIAFLIPKEVADGNEEMYINFKYENNEFSANVK